jgi:hypothetical protein
VSARERKRFASVEAIFARRLMWLKAAATAAAMIE